MKIAIVTPGFSASDEDWCIPALQDLACRLGERHEVHVFATTYPHRLSEYMVKGIRVSSFGDGRYGRLALMRQMWKTLAGIEAAHHDKPFDVLHGFWADQGGIVTTWAARRLSVPNIVTSMAGELTFEPLIGYGKRKRPIVGRMGRFGARSADTLIALSHFHAHRIKMEQATLEPRVIPFGIDANRFSPRGSAQLLDGQIPVLSVGSLVPVKGHAIVLQAFAIASKQVAGLHLHLVGEGQIEPALRSHVEDLGISRSVSFHGHVEHHMLPRIYRGASFSVLGSYFESLGMVIPEAAACGLVTIGSAVGAAPDFCPEEFLSQPGDSAALAANMTKLATDSGIRKRLARNAVEKVNKGYVLEQSIRAHEDLYRCTKSRS